MKNNNSLIVHIKKLSDISLITPNTKYINIDITNYDHDIITYFIENGSEYLYSEIIDNHPGYIYVNYDEFIEAETIIDLLYANMPDNLTSLEMARYIYISLGKIVSFDMRYDIPPQFDINANEEEILYSKKENFESYFLPAFYIVDKKKNKVVEKDEMENLVTITLSHKTRGKKNDTKESTLVPCVEKHTKLKEFLKTNAINSAF